MEMTLEERSAISRQKCLEKALAAIKGNKSPISFLSLPTNPVTLATDINIKQTAEARNPKWSAETQAMIDFVDKNFGIIKIEEIAYDSPKAKSAQILTDRPFRSTKRIM